MATDRLEQYTGARLILLLASSVVVIVGLRLGAPILLPTVLALFLVILSLPVMLWLVKRGLHRWISALLTILLTVAVVSVFILLAGMSASELQRSIGSGPVVIDSLALDTLGRDEPLVPSDEVVVVTAPSDSPPDLVDRFLERRDAAVAWIARVQAEWNLPFETVDAAAMVSGIVNPDAVVDFVGGAVGRIAQVVSNAFVVFLVMAFMLIEATVLPAKLRKAFGSLPAPGERLPRIVREIQTYLVIKTGASVITGILLGLWAHVLGLEFPILLGMTAFLLNYVPTVGSIIAAVPAIALSFLLYGTVGHALGVVAGYAFVNMVIGNLLEPNLMGHRLGISTLAVILSLLFWGWLWGPLGALLSVPLTAVVKIWLEHTPDLRWAAVLLDKGSGPDITAPAVESEALPTGGS